MEYFYFSGKTVLCMRELNLVILPIKEKNMAVRDPNPFLGDLNGILDASHAMYCYEIPLFIM